MRRYLLPLLLLAACVPTLESDPAEVAKHVTFSCESVCVVSAPGETITAVYAGIDGPIESSYCSGVVTAVARPCVAVEKEFRALVLVTGSYGNRVVLGRPLKPPGAKSFARVNLEGFRVTFPVELTAGLKP